MTSMQRFDPFREMRHFSRLLNSPLWASQRWGDPLEHDEVESAAAWRIPMDVRRDDQQLTVHASLPGFAAADVDVSISPDRVLSVKASRQSEVTRESEEYLMRERRAGSFARAVRLPRRPGPGRRRRGPGARRAYRNRAGGRNGADPAPTHRGRCDDRRRVKAGRTPAGTQWGRVSNPPLHIMEAPAYSSFLTSPAVIPAPFRAQRHWRYGQARRFGSVLTYTILLC